MEKEITTIVIKDGKSYDISDSILLRDYHKLGYIPSVDRLLDWRLFLMNKKHKNSMESLICETELLAVDYILNLKQTK